MNEAEKPAGSPGSEAGTRGFWAELKQRKVARAAIAYIVVSWVIIQVAETTFSGFGIPDWVFRFVVIALILFFPVVVLLAWAYDLTRGGIQNTARLRREANGHAVESAGQKRRNRFALLLAAGIPTLLFGALAFVFYLRTEPVTEPLDEPVAVVASVPSIAVLPLVNMSANPDNAFFAAGVHEDILTNLSRIPDLDVVSRTTAMKYISSSLSLSEIGREMGVKYIVEGSVRRVNNHVRVTVQLIDSEQDKHLWANNYDRELTDIFATQSAVSRDITQSIHFEIRPESFKAVGSMPTHSVKAYDLYTKAVSLDRGETESEESLATIRVMLEQAVEEDPDFAEAWGLLNENYDHAIRNTLINGWHGDNPEAREAFILEMLPLARAALDKAVALDPDNVETLLAQGSDYYAEQNVEGFQEQRRKYIDRALELYPDNAMAWYVFAWWYRIEGQWEKADFAFRKALDLDPMNARILNGANWHFDDISDFETVELIASRLDTSLGTARPNVKLANLRNVFIETADESLLMEMILLFDRERGNFENEFVEVDWFHTLHLMLGDLRTIAESEDHWEALPSQEPAVWSYFLAGQGTRLIAQSRTGMAEEAQETARRLVEHSRLARQFPWADRALVLAYVELGNMEQAWELANFMVESVGDSYDPYRGAAASALSRLDVDAAARLLVDYYEAVPESLTSDFLAAFCAINPELISHPDVVAFYVEEGKWVNFLSRCSPAYLPFSEPSE